MKNNLPGTQPPMEKPQLKQGVDFKHPDGIVTLYRRHPITGMDSEDMAEFFKTALPDEIQELAAERRAGAKYYWLEDQEGNYERNEINNFGFVCYVLGHKIKIVDLNGLTTDYVYPLHKYGLAPVQKMPKSMRQSFRQKLMERFKRKK
jgi:hypothetical protein